MSYYIMAILLFTPEKKVFLLRSGASLQICVGKKEDTDGYVKLCSGKKRGLVPTHSLEEI